MDKLKIQSRDVVGGNVQKIAALFPQCVTERLEKDGKSELAMLYRPDLKEGNARRTLYNWMRRNEKLMAALDAVGYDPKRRTLTPREVAIIVDFIGEP